MPTFNHSNPPFRQTLGVAALLMCASLAHAENAQSTREQQRTYQADRQRCLSGQSGQNQASCLQEAGAVRQNPRSVQTPVADKQLQDNALQRCDALSGDDRQSCIARIQGQGSVQGSVESGGIFRELSEPAKP